MNKLITILFLSIHVLCFSQLSDTIEINQFKTTQIIFNEEVSLVEPGTGDLQVKNKNVDNVLILQSIVPQADFIITNLFIKTKSNIYNPIIKYNENPKKTTFLEKDLKSAIGGVKDLGTKSNINKPVIQTGSSDKRFSNNSTDKNSLQNVKDSDLKLVEAVLKRGEAYKPSREYTTGMWFKFLAHFVYNGKFYLKFEIDNTSDLDFEIEHFFFSIQSRKKRNVTETQREVNYNRFLNETDRVNAKEKKVLIFEFPTFSMNKTEEFLIELKEKGGARNFIVGVPYFIINQPVKLEIK
ncbi:DUF4138 domain-containing protein [Chryseobacterium oncorhynchi]|uniref:DUF4138 domain-containing protein n=1 Tax=Chryseobacterium oncorhynchi TaxID=741074 RepID=A0A316WEZ4_9FLAO|nr:DUF4138 domain-containing protein [Chryseobacterium oncorhynchi]PWN59981.1 hypothetical protein C1638_020655 [Chryseobacterium oncorhynchi]